MTGEAPMCPRCHIPCELADHGHEEKYWTCPECGAMRLYKREEND